MSEGDKGERVNVKRERERERQGQNLGATTLSIMTLPITTFRITTQHKLHICSTQHK
jgi:hypothetical protein